MRYQKIFSLLLLSMVLLLGGCAKQTQPTPQPPPQREPIIYPTASLIYVAESNTQSIFIRSLWTQGGEARDIFDIIVESTKESYSPGDKINWEKELVMILITADDAGNFDHALVLHVRTDTGIVIDHIDTMGSDEDYMVRTMTTVYRILSAMYDLGVKL